MQIEPPRRFLVLKTELSGESFIKVHGVCVEDGFLLALKRLSKKSTSVRPDLFEEAEVAFERGRNNADMRFIKDYRVLDQYASIGDHYRSLKEASRFARLLVDNGSVLVVDEAFYDQLKATLRAFAANRAPEVVHLKSAYLLLRNEGFPVKEDWWPTLSPEERSQVATLINRPVADSLSDESREAAESALDHLHRWVRYNTELILAEG